MASLGQRIAQGIRTQRQRTRLSQLAVADKAGLSIQYVGMVERGERSPSLEVLERFARALGVDPADLFSGGGR